MYFLSSITYFSKHFRESMRSFNWIRFFLMFVFIMPEGEAFSQARYCDAINCERGKAQDTPNVQIGQTLEFLLASEGDPFEAIPLTGKDSYLHSYYYREANTTYIVNTETGYICDAVIGKHIGNCLPDTEQKGIDK